MESATAAAFMLTTNWPGVKLMKCAKPPVNLGNTYGISFVLAAFIDDKEQEHVDMSMMTLYGLGTGDDIIT